MDATMPEHAHGMATVPKTARQPEDDRWLTEGCKLHMYGRWVFAVEYDAEPGVSDAAEFEFRFEPPSLTDG